MPKKDHTQEFLKALKDELKKDKFLEDPKLEKLMKKTKTLNKYVPPSTLINRLAYINKRFTNQLDQETWISMATLVYEMWKAENYPEEEIP